MSDPTRNRLGVLAPSALANEARVLSPPVASAGTPKPRRTFGKKSTKNCNEAVDWVRSLGTLTEGTHEAIINVDFGRTKAEPTKQDGKVMFSAHLKPTIDMASSVTRVILVSWPNMTAGEKEAVRAYTDAIQAHEDGHFSVAEHALRNAAETIRADGESWGEAEREFNSLLEAYKIRVTGKLDKARDEYDVVTRHGANQSAIGGKDAVLRCSG
jgi:hypothetical protein